MKCPAPNRELIIVVVLATYFTSLSAQITTAGISGAVTDAQGLVVPSVKVRVVNERTGQTFTAETNETGNYLVRALPVGFYAVAIQKEGFKSHKQSGIELTANQLARIDVQLEVGTISDAVSVQAELSPVETSTGTLGVLVDTRRIEGLPLSSRNLLALAALTPGATSVILRDQPSISQQDISVNGARGSATNIMLDGASMFYAHRGSGLVQPPPDAIQEVKIVTGGVSAEFTRGSAAVSAITRGGTNAFHGSLWDYLRNDALNARSFFAGSVSKERYNQFGATAGGPIVRNKAFFFGAFQGRQSPSDRLVSSAFPPTAQERTGDLSRTLGSSPIDPLNNQPFPNSLVPRARMDPVALKVLDRIPQPNQPNGRYITQISATSSDRTYMGRVDYDFSLADRTTFRYFFDNRINQDPFTGSNVAGYGGGTATDRPQNWNLAHAHTFTPALLLNLRASVTRFRYSLNHWNHDTLATLGAKFITGGGPGALPNLSVSGRFSGGTSQQEGDAISDTREMGGDLSWFRGGHELKFGANLMWVRFYYGVADRAYGVFSFDGTFTKNALADFLIGQASNLQQQQHRANDVRYYAPGFYAQDRWRATRRLTLNAGLRWEIYTPWRGHYVPSCAFVPGARSQFMPGAPVGMLYDRDPDFPFQQRAFNLGPRVGFAYDVFGNGKTSLRGGYGISYEQLIGQVSAQNSPPFAVDLNTSNVGPLSDPQRFIDVPYGKPVDVKNPVFPSAVSLRGSFVGKIVTPYSQNINLTLEQQVLADTILQLSYVSTLGRHEATMPEQNPAVYVPGSSTASNTDQRRMYGPRFTSVVGWATDGNLNYHALQVNLIRRLARGLTYSFAYAFAKSIDESSRSDGAEGWWRQNPFDRRSERGLGNYDIRNRFVASWVWELPFLRKSPSLGGKVLGGWALSGISTIQDGMPFTVSSGRDNSLTGVAHDRPNLIGDPRLSASRAKRELLARYFDPSKFVANSPGQYGNAGRNILIGPGRLTFDLSMMKSFKLSESKRIEFRCDAFNAFNRANFSGPASNLASPATLGVITSAGAGRAMQLALRFEF